MREEVTNPMDKQFKMSPTSWAEPLRCMNDVEVGIVLEVKPVFYVHDLEPEIWLSLRHRVDYI